MDAIPDELVLQVLSWLDITNLVSLQRVCRRLFELARDSELWRSRCYERSSFNRTSRLGVSTEHKATDSFASWDPSYLHERVDWYEEYIARHAPLCTKWFQAPALEGGSWGIKHEARGVGLFKSSTSCKVVAPLDDSSVCLWNLDPIGTGQGTPGSIIARSRKGLLSSLSRSGPNLDNMGIVECVSLDNARQKGYFAVQNTVIEVDIETLQISACERFPFSISALSTCDPNLPLTVATTLSIHLFDHRRAANSSSNDSEDARITETLESAISPTRWDFISRLFSTVPQSEYAPLFQPGPLSILHHSSVGLLDATAGEIYVAGRFPSLLLYDRRTFPRLRSTFHSGAKLCSLTSMPVPFDALEEARQRNRLSFRGMQGLDEHSGSTLIAGGEYNGKGSLELYGLSFDRNNPPITPSYKNRVSASSCKLLSVATQGTRVIVSDGNGYMSWFERDATTLIRRYNFMESTFSCQSSAPRFARSLEVARKIIPAGRSWTESSAVNSNEVLYWTGDNIGIVGTCTPEEDSEGAAEIAEQAAELGQERAYGETMHRALESQASEVGWLRGLGLADPYR